MTVHLIDIRSDVLLRFIPFYFFWYTFSFVRSHCLPFLFLESERQMIIFLCIYYK